MGPSYQSAFQRFFEQRWYSRPGLLWCLLPLEWLFRLIARLRRVYLESNQPALASPVVVVGNIAVGGTGKTPVIIALVKYLRQQGYTPGVVSRGYGRLSREVMIVDEHSRSDQVGDEPLEIFHHSHASVCVAAKRVEAARRLIAQRGCDILLADDGLQHYALKRDVEVLILDAKNPFGNGHCLPVGPLREPPKRLQEVDLVLTAGGDCGQGVSFKVEALNLVNLKTGEERPLADIATLGSFHAIAAIGKPDKFFCSLRPFLGESTMQTHAFPDHHRFTAADFHFTEKKSVVMTAKDATKCAEFAIETWWYVRIEAKLPEEFLTALKTKLD